MGVKHKKVMAAYKKTKSYKEFQAAKKAKKFGKKPKDKTAPKRPLTAFFVFANTIRDSVRQNNPEASIGEIGKILGQEWNSLDESAKQSYQAKANKNKEKYAKTLTKYQKSKKSFCLETSKKNCSKGSQKSSQNCFHHFQQKKSCKTSKIDYFFNFKTRTISGIQFCIYTHMRVYQPLFLWRDRETHSPLFFSLNIRENFLLFFSVLFLYIIF